MELVASDIVVSPPPLQVTRQRSHKRRAVADLPMRLALMDALAPIVSRLTTEEVRRRLGGDEDASQLRHDIGHIKARRAGSLGFSRLLYVCEGLDVDSWAVIAAASVRRIAA
ncbi:MULTISPECIES: hypothetical protein [unclassified Methylobacterium]|uniref:hypothetical protein n=1 Tax=unclassified Methylobacterium TaxID=2615210 RepID=UPI000CBE32DD|nr:MULTISPECIES: hypothetical protein [unclassified Methylobacterium]PIU06641.1 MAG: hypothetical protein COT56_08390 [Methylobacterium sp. CG09_land_8_20_14_0_10_71_15]PIU12099.1 MAG: hypothetical protein COT28_16855 [Methylobacterium sp. CG08_land_8_20_14_0_20_71_15]GBU19679.1 hypothetical protein AwMethylo_38940 [Methylobacterium sp.]